MNFVKLIQLNIVNPIQNGLFWRLLMDGGQKGPLPKICYTYPTMMKLGTVIPKKDPKYI